MRINIVTGASGFVGSHLVKTLLASGEIVWVVLRPMEGISIKERSEKLFSDHLIKHPNNFKVIEGDVMEENLGIATGYIQELPQKNIFLWHLAANLSFSTKDKDAVLCTNCVGTMNAINLANHVAKRYIHMSTAYVCGDSQSMFHERDLNVGQKFRNYYEISKFEAEKQVGRHCKIPYLVFRPSIIMGDAYEGKAEGCTFGYYRFAYMFFIFKNWLIEKILKGSFLIKKVLFLFGFRYNKKDGFLYAPWLVLPYPSGGTVDMVPIDYVIKSMINSVDNPSLYNKTVHLTNPDPPSFKFALSSLIADLGYRDVKFIKIPPAIFRVILRTLHYIIFPLRVKTRSAMWYLPYISRKYCFSHENNQLIEPPKPASITREFLRKINIYAQKEIFSNIKN